MQYRPEIDGLRAVAVIPVILFHAGFAPFSGGYVGVDVFFVISGYLITALLLEDIRKERFSIARFYERRARRILPALAVVLAATLPFAWFWMLPGPFESYARSMLFTALFLSNVHFWENTGYFATSTEAEPLLHTWSLAVEEQFYLLFPLCLWLLSRKSGRVLLVWFALVAGLSLLLAEWGVRNEPEVNFFFTFSRVWELLAGSICAVLLAQRPQPVQGALGAAGLLMILAAVVLYDATTPFPSVWALLPVGGTMLIILFAAPGTWVATALSWKPVVAIGLVSYSAYLWHQPLFAFARIRSLTEPSHLLMAILCLLTFVLAALSWRFVEQPFRRSSARWLPTRHGVFLASTGVISLFAVIGALGLAGKGLPERLPDNVQRIVAYDGVRSPHQETCQFSGKEDTPPHPIQGCGSTTPDVVMIGDSHSAAIATTVVDRLSKDGAETYAVARAGCIALPGFIRLEKSMNRGCEEFKQGMLDFARNGQTPILVITSRFPLYLHGTRFDNGEGGIETGRPGEVDVSGTADPGTAGRYDRVLQALPARIDALAQEFDIVLVEPIPEAGWNVPQMLAKKALFQGASADLSTDATRYGDRADPVLAAFDQITAPNVIRIQSAALFCAAGRCDNARNGLPLYSDDDHLSAPGAALVAEEIAKAVQSLLSARQ